jgi:8-oxo-dGTP pyrophosphatase MutT (NUDIX family)
MTYSTRHDLEQRLRTRLRPVGHAFEGHAARGYHRSDFDLSPDFRPQGAETARAAAVLIGFTDMGEDLGVLLTLRPETMSQHAGQVAFPGGRVDAGDADALAAALRESEEEVGLLASEVEILGRIDPYLTSTNYLVTPIVGLIAPGFVPIPHVHEVAAVFETPAAFLMDPANHERHERVYAGRARPYYAMRHDGRYIWGATAGMLKALYDRLYSD